MLQHRSGHTPAHHRRCGCPSHRSRCLSWRQQDSTCKHTQFRSPWPSRFPLASYDLSNTCSLKSGRIILQRHEKLQIVVRGKFRLNTLLVCNRLHCKQDSKNANTLSTVVIGFGITFGMTRNRLYTGLTRARELQFRKGTENYTMLLPSRRWTWKSSGRRIRRCVADMRRSWKQNRVISENRSAT